MPDRNRNRRQEHRDDLERGQRGERQSEQFQDDRPYRDDEESGTSYGQMGEEYSQGRHGDQQSGAQYQDDRHGSSWRDEGSFGRGGRDSGGGERQSRPRGQSQPGGSFGPARYDNSERGGSGSFNSEDYRTGGSEGPRELRGYGRGETMRGGAHSSGSYGDESYGVGGSRGSYGQQGGYQSESDRGFFDKAGDEVASWFGNEEAARRREMDHRGRGPANYKRSDDRILEDACDRLTEDRGVDARNVQVTVQGGEVTLDGTVSSRRHKHRAEDVVHDISGVGHVQNNLRTTENARNDDRVEPGSNGSSERNPGTLA